MNGFRPSQSKFRDKDNQQSLGDNDSFSIHINTVVRPSHRVQTRFINDVGVAWSNVVTLIVKVIFLIAQHLFL